MCSSSCSGPVWPGLQYRCGRLLALLSLLLNATTILLLSLYLHHCDQQLTGDSLDLQTATQRTIIAVYIALQVYYVIRINKINYRTFN